MLLRRTLVGFLSEIRFESRSAASRRASQSI